VKYQLRKSRDYGVNLCEGCLEKQREIDRLREEVQQLKAKLKQRERKQRAGVFGAATPSSLKPLKANSEQNQRAKQGGARQGHPGHGRSTCSAEQADEIRRVELSDRCPDCGSQLGAASLRARTVIDIAPVVVKRICYELERRSCGHCHKSFQSPAPGVLPKALLGNQLLSEIVGEHYLQGVPLSSLARRFGLNLGTVIEARHRLGRTFQPVLKQLKEEYRSAPVRHADETSWRTDGQNGYSWLFCTEQVSLCLYRQTRSASVVREVLGEKELDGVLVVDRYNGYNQVKCRIQYC
jgi:transposase